MDKLPPRLLSSHDPLRKFPHPKPPPPPIRWEPLGMLPHLIRWKRVTPPPPPPARGNKRALDDSHSSDADDENRFHDFEDYERLQRYIQRSRRIKRLRYEEMCQVNLASAKKVLLVL